VRVLTITNAYPPHYYGGYELTCRDVMERFAAAGHTVRVLTSSLRVPGVATGDEPDVDRGLEVYWDWETNRETVSATPIGRLRVERNNRRRLVDALETFSPDVVSVWGFSGLSMAMLTEIEARRLPMVLVMGNDWLVYAHVTDGWIRMWKNWPYRWPRTVAGVTTRLPTLDTAQATFVSEFTKSRCNRYAQWQFEDGPVLPAGIDLRDFPITSHPTDEWTWQLLYVGRIDVTKGVETLVRAFAELPDVATLTVLGGGDRAYRAALDELAASLGCADRITFGAVPRNELAERYAGADAVVFPSEWDEPFGLVPLEAMACGTPVVATARGGAADFLADGVNCLLYPTFDSRRLTAAITRLAGDSDLRRMLAAGGRDTAGHYTIDRYAEGLLRVHEDHARDGAARSRTPL
jgi:glycosyltransferase involved in cell wall biosynthesis